MKSSTHLEDFEISFAAFVNSSRSVTFILQNEYKNNLEFISWYGNSNNYKDGRWVSEDDESQNTKIYEMSHDELCKFFVKLRNRITKEGINGFMCGTNISSFNSSVDLINPPRNSSLIIGSRGMYHLVCEGTSQEDCIPARTRGRITTRISISDVPRTHLSKPIPVNQQDILSLSIMYYEYLKLLVEEWTGILNVTDSK